MTPTSLPSDATKAAAMTKDNEAALRCAEHLESWYGKQAIAVTHLRRLVAENEALRAQCEALLAIHGKKQ